MFQGFGQLSDQERQALEEEAGKALEQPALIKGELAEWVRMTRSREPWDRYDSVVIAEGANNRDDGWFNTWADFANASQIEWFKGRGSSIGESYTNQSRERTDFAQDFYQMMIEFIAPIGMADLESDPNDATFFPLWFTTTLPGKMVFSLQLAQADTILQIPGTHAPGGSGTSGIVMDQMTGPTVYPGTNGAALISNTWKWPEPVLVPAKASVSMFARIDNPAKTFLAQFEASPGGKEVPAVPPGPAGDTVRLPNEYIIKITHRGPRYLQLRGARSS